MPVASPQGTEVEGIPCSLASSELVLQVLWRQAREASEAAGHPHQDSEGRVTKSRGLGKSEALRGYCADVLRIHFPE